MRHQFAIMVNNYGDTADRGISVRGDSKSIIWITISRSIECLEITEMIGAINFENVCNALIIHVAKNLPNPTMLP